jgi:hypothetical protein
VNEDAIECNSTKLIRSNTIICVFPNPSFSTISWRIISIKNYVNTSTNACTILCFSKIQGDVRESSSVVVSVEVMIILVVK